MLKKTITYTDYNGLERTEDFYFNLSKAEIMEMELSTSGGFSATVNKIIAAKDVTELFGLFKGVILKAYGEKSPDGKRFIKSEELSTAFAQTEAYSILFMELSMDANAAADFMNGIIPADISKQLSENENVAKAFANGDVSGDIAKLVS